MKHITRVTKTPARADAITLDTVITALISVLTALVTFLDSKE
jgi:hypothetical protein